MHEQLRGQLLFSTCLSGCVYKINLRELCVHSSNCSCQISIPDVAGSLIFRLNKAFFNSYNVSLNLCKLQLPLKFSLIDFLSFNVLEKLQVLAAKTYLFISNKALN